jgi:hypothetical protein
MPGAQYRALFNRDTGMNTWAITSERDPRGAPEFDRRVYRAEFTKILGCGLTWFRVLEARGAIPPGRRDLGGKRLWWLASEVNGTLAKLAAEAQRDRSAA